MKGQPRISFGRFAAAAAAALALGGASAASGQRTRTAAVPPCATSSLVIWLDTQGNGAAGSFYYSLNFTNLSAGACTLFGYPGVSGVDLAGAQLGSAASRDAVRRAATVTLRPGGSAHTVVRMVDVGNYPRARCHPASAAGLRVYPPGQRAARIVPYPFAACSRAGAGYLSVETLRPGIGRAGS